MTFNTVSGHIALRLEYVGAPTWIWMRIVLFLFPVRSPGASCGWQQQKGGSSRGVSPWRLGKYLWLRLEQPECSRGVQTAWTQVHIYIHWRDRELFFYYYYYYYTKILIFLPPQWWIGSSRRVRSGERAHPPGPGEVHGEGGVPGRVSLSGPEHPGLQTPAGRRGEVWRHAAGVGGTGQASRAELWAEEAGGGGEQEEEPGGGKHAQVGFRT